MLRKKTSAEDPADWFAFADERLTAADVVWKAEGLTATGIELLHEAVERYLKGFLVASGWRLVKTHDLERLVADALPYEAKFAKYVSLAQKLTNDFFAQHYPGEDLTEVGRDYELLRQETGELRGFLKASLPDFLSNTDPSKL
jgi:HEPN domain-containing protein